MSGETLAPTPEAITLAGQRGRPARRHRAAQPRACARCPEERNGHAAVGEFSLTDNGALTGRDRMEMVRFGLIDPGKATELRRRSDRRLSR